MNHNHQQIYFLSESDQLWRNELIKQTARATRLPVARVMMLTWSQLEKPNKIRTTRGREVELDETLALALDRLPRYSNKWIFATSPYPPLIPDEILDPAREYVRKRRFLRFYREKA